MTRNVIIRIEHQLSGYLANKLAVRTKSRKSAGFPGGYQESLTVPCKSIVFVVHYVRIFRMGNDERNLMVVRRQHDTTDRIRPRPVGSYLQGVLLDDIQRVHAASRQ